MSATTPPTGEPGHQPTPSVDNRVTPTAAQAETHSIAENALTREQTGSGYLPKWVTHAASSAASSVKTLYHTYFDHDYALAYSDMMSRKADRVFTRLESTLHATPPDLDLLRYCFSFYGDALEYSILVGLRRLFESDLLTVKDLETIGQVAPSWSDESMFFIVSAFFERRSSIFSLPLMEAFCSQFKHRFFRCMGNSFRSVNAVLCLNRDPLLLKVFLNAYSSARKEAAGHFPDMKESAVSVSFGASLGGMTRLGETIGETRGRGRPNLEVLKIYFDYGQEAEFFKDGGYGRWWFEHIDLPQMELALEGLKNFANKYPQFKHKIANFLSPLVHQAIDFESVDGISDKGLAVIKTLFSLHVPLRSFFSGTAWRKLETLYTEMVTDEPKLTLNEAERLSRLLDQFNKRFNPTQEIPFEWSHVMKELSIVATRELKEDEAKTPRLLISKALYQWLERKGDKEELLNISHGEKEIRLSPLLALALLNVPKDIAWGELTAEPRTIDCTLDGGTGVVILSAVDQKLLADYSNYFSTYFSTMMQSPLLNDVSDEAVLDLLKYLADPFLTFTDVGNAIDILTIADFFQAPILVDRAVTWLNNHFASLETGQEREAFIQVLLDEDSPIGHLVLSKIEAGDTYKQLVQERLKSIG